MKNKILLALRRFEAYRYLTTESHVYRVSVSSIEEDTDNIGDYIATVSVGRISDDLPYFNKDKVLLQYDKQNRCYTLFYSGNTAIRDLLMFAFYKYAETDDTMPKQIFYVEGEDLFHEIEQEINAIFTLDTDTDQPVYLN